MGLQVKKLTIYSMIPGLVVAVLFASRNASLLTILINAGFVVAVSLVAQVAAALFLRYIESKKKEKH